MQYTYNFRQFFSSTLTNYKNKTQNNQSVFKNNIPERSSRMFTGIETNISNMQQSKIQNVNNLKVPDNEKAGKRRQ